MTGKPGRKWASLRGEHTEVRELASVLRDVADGRAVTLRDLEARMPFRRSAISQNLSGSKRPAWEFISAFLEACTGRDRRAKEILEAKIRPLWEAANPARAQPIANLPALSDGPTPTELGTWVTALHETARSQQVVARLQLSVSRHQDLVGGLIHMIERLNRAVAELTAERDALRHKVIDREIVTEELAQARALLVDTQERLDASERFQAQTSRRLDEAVRQLEIAERLKADALTQAEATRRRLARLERHAVRLVGEPDDEDLPEDYDVTALMGEADQSIAAEILRHVDDVLEQEADNLDDLHSAVVGPPDGAGGAGALSAGQPLDNATTRTDNEAARDQPPSPTPRAAVTAPPRRRNALWGWEIPFRNRNFVGREQELADLRSFLLAGSTALIGQPVQAVYGLGGVGKTELAAQYAHRYRDEYDLVWWICAEREESITAAFIGLGTRLGLENFRHDERDYSVGVVMDVVVNRGCSLRELAANFR